MNEFGLSIYDIYKLFGNLLIIWLFLEHDGCKVSEIIKQNLNSAEVQKENIKIYIYTEIDRGRV